MSKADTTRIPEILQENIHSFFSFSYLQLNAELFRIFISVKRAKEKIQVWTCWRSSTDKCWDHCQMKRRKIVHSLEKWVTLSTYGVITLKDHTYSTSANFPPSPQLIYNIKYMQPPLLSLLFLRPPPPTNCRRHKSMVPQRESCTLYPSNIAKKCIHYLT